MSLVLLHGLGDTHASFTKLAQQMNLPETACVSVQGPANLLDLGGFVRSGIACLSYAKYSLTCLCTAQHWGEDIIFNSTSGGLDPDSGFKQSTELLKSVVQESLVEKCGFSPREIAFFGYGQGGMAALQFTSSLASQSKDLEPIELGGVISIGAGLPQ